jgi:UTP--glucose-1-phosphate uridylyltransferase
MDELPPPQRPSPGGPSSPSCQVRTAVVPAGGLGSRWLPVSRAVPKELLPVLRRPALHWVLEEAVACGIERVVLVTAPGKEALARYLSIAPPWSAAGTPPRVDLVVQPQPRGLGDAVRQAVPLVPDEPAVAVLLPDNLFDEHPPLLARLLAVHAARGCSVLALMECPAEELRRHGAATVAGPDGASVSPVVGLVEKPADAVATGRLAVVGRYVLTRAVLEALGDLQPAHAGEVQLTDAIRTVLPAEPVLGVRLSGALHDIGTVDGWLATLMRVGSRDDGLDPRVRQALAAGSALLDAPGQADDA